MTRGLGWSGSTLLTLVTESFMSRLDGTWLVWDVSEGWLASIRGTLRPADLLSFPHNYTFFFLLLMCVNGQHGLIEDWRHLAPLRYELTLLFRHRFPPGPERIWIVDIFGISLAFGILNRVYPCKWQKDDWAPCIKCTYVMYIEKSFVDICIIWISC